MAEPNKTVQANDGKSTTPTKIVTDTSKANSGTADPLQNNQWTTVPASPPRFITFEQLMSAANGVKNMTLAHEIVVDNDFKIADPKTTESGLEKKVRDVVHKAFWDHLNDQLNAEPPMYTSALALLDELKSVLQSLTLPQHTRLRTQIDEVFDMALITQQVEHKSLDVLKYADYVIDTLAKLCAPVRDENIRTLREERSIVPLFRGMFELMDLMKMDMANFTIHQIRPYLQVQSVEYERNKFNEFLKHQQEAGIDGLLLTRRWLMEANCLEPPSTTCHEPHIKDSTPPNHTASMTSLGTPASVLNLGYLMLISTNMYDNIENFPETLLMDMARFRDLHQKTWKLTLVSAMLLVTYNTVGGPISGVSGLKDQLKKHIMIILEGCHTNTAVQQKAANVTDQVIKEIDEALLKLGQKKLSSLQVQLLKAQISEVIGDDHSVRKLVRERVTNFMLSTLSHDHKKPMKIPSGLSAVETELTQVSGQFLRLVSHNRSVFSEHYGQIIENLSQRIVVVGGSVGSMV